MSSDPAIEFSGVSKHYRIGAKASLQSLFSRGAHREQSRDFWALQDVSFCVQEGDVYGIIGPNGAGKSTILKLLAGVTTPDQGNISIAGGIAPLIELGAGFHPELSGRENVYLNGALMGLSRKEIDQRYEEIVSFAELDGFMETPVKHYSSGMFVRLGFSLAVHTDREILLVDEVLSVGDERFQRKCLKKFLQFRNEGRTIVVVSHDLTMVSSICTNVLFLAQGRVVASGSVDGAIGRYLHEIGGGDGLGVLQRGKTTVLFNGGRASIFHGGREVTKKLGLYTSMLINRSDLPGAGIWHESTKAAWRCTRIGGEGIRCRGEYISAALAQEWELVLDEGGILHWRVWLEVFEPVRLERHQANVMLSENFENWSGGDFGGEFPPEFTSRDYQNWEILATLPGSRMAARASDGLPTVHFSSTSSEFAATVVNSNFFFSGRVLMFLHVDVVNLQPGHYDYFAGEVRLDEP